MFTVTGCANLLNLSKDAWASRSGENLLVSCNHSLEKWHLVCRGTEWVGSYGNCSSGRYTTGILQVLCFVGVTKATSLETQKFSQWYRGYCTSANNAFRTAWLRPPHLPPLPDQSIDRPVNWLVCRFAGCTGRVYAYNFIYIYIHTIITDHRFYYFLCHFRCVSLHRKSGLHVYHCYWNCSSIPDYRPGSLSTGADPSKQRKIGIDTHYATQ